MKLNQAIKHALDGEAILFLGSGFSFGASNIGKEEFSTGSSLADELSKEVDINEKIDLDVAAGIYMEIKGYNSLISLLQKKYTALDVNPDHIHCASIPWKRVYTTNYDNVFELAAKKSNIKYVPVELSSNVKEYLDKRNVCVHINGYIDNLTKNTLNDSFKLTTKSYLTDSFNRSKWSSVFRQDINLAKSIIFVGYSMYDLDIARIVGSVEDIKSKCVFITGDNPGIAEAHVIKQIGRLVPGGLNKFIDSIANIQKSHDSISKEFTPRSFTEYKVANTDKLPGDRDRYDLFLRGDLKKDLLFKSLFSSERSYIVPRKMVDLVFEKHREGVQNFLIHGNLGNGKTIATEQICCSAVRAGWRVFILNEFDKYAIADLSDINKLDGKVLIVVESYSRHLSFVEQLLMRQTDNIAKLFTERSSINDYYIDEIFTHLGDDPIQILDCNYLNQEEVDLAISLLDSSALWKSKKEMGYIQKRNHIQRNLGGEFQGILLEILESPDIQSRLKASFDGLSPDSDTFKVVILSLILKALNYAPTMNTISELLDIENPLKLILAKKIDLSEIFSMKGTSFEVRSSVLSSFLLTHMIPGVFIADVMTYAYIKCDELIDVDPTYKNMQRELRRYSVIQSLLPDEHRRNLLLNYYEEIKNLRSSKINPFFWVQYGIARLTYRDFEIAEQCFSKAYAIGENYEMFDGYQIDNHYARLLLEKSIYEPESGTPMDLFREAHSLLTKQIGNASQNKHYPYRVASLYKKFLELHIVKLNDDDLAYIKRAAGRVLTTAKTLPHELQENKYVTNCIVNLETICG